MADLTGIDEELCASSPWDYSDLRALYVNCTLKRSPEASSGFPAGAQVRRLGCAPCPEIP